MLLCYFFKWQIYIKDNSDILCILEKDELIMEHILLYILQLVVSKLITNKILPFPQSIWLSRDFIRFFFPIGR